MDKLERIFEKVLKESHETDDFFELRMVVLSNEHLQEKIEIGRLMEMSKLTKRETGLPVDIWVDEGKTFLKSGHSRRIKFQGDKSDPNTHNWVPLTISDNPQIEGENVSHNLNSKEIRKIKLFIIENLEALTKLGDDFGITDFSKVMKKV